jgi:hypothetical protein
MTLLALVRGEGELEPTVVQPAPGDEAFTLAVDAFPDRSFTTYRLTVRGAGGERLYHRGDLSANALDLITVTFPVAFLPPGDYRLTLEGLTADGTAESLGTFPFRFLPPQG